MRLELTRVGLLVELANHYTTRGALPMNALVECQFMVNNGQEMVKQLNLVIFRLFLKIE